MKVLVIGGGIGELAAALSLHAVGIDCVLFEQSRSMHELGVGMNLLLNGQPGHEIKIN